MYGQVIKFKMLLGPAFDPPSGPAQWWFEAHLQVQTWWVTASTVMVRGTHVFISLLYYLEPERALLPSVLAHTRNLFVCWGFQCT